MKKESSFVPIIVLLIVILGMALIPLKVIGYGFLPQDDALRHSAKVISGKTWDEVLVLRPEGKIDAHPGWHALLGLVYKITGSDADGLVIFSIMTLFILFCITPIFLLDRPEAWPTALLLLAVTEASFLMRLFLGRPYIFTMVMVVVLCLIWPKLKDKKNSSKAMLLIIVLAALSTWIHGSWYLFALVISAFLLSREWQVARLLTVSFFCGIIIGALFTGHPYIFLKHNLSHMSLALGSTTLQRMLVSEFQPFMGDPLMVLAVLGMLMWRHIRGAWNKRIVDNPVFVLVVISWIGGFLVRRSWLDWGVPALSIWMATEFQDAFRPMMKLFSWKRVFLTMAVVTTLYLAVTSDFSGRWTQNLTKEYLSPEDPEQAPWLPGPGGIIYSDKMTIFYDTFFKNPKAPWRYILGFEAAIMLPEDLAIFRKIQWNFGADKAFEPWVKKMKRDDRLIIQRPAGNAPSIPGLEWHYAATDIWIGRLPAHQK